MPMTKDARHNAASPSLHVGRLLVVGLACFSVAWGGIELTRASGRVAAIWPGNAVLVAVLLHLPPRSWPAYGATGFLANLAANLISGDAFSPAFLLGIANTIEVATTVFLMRKLDGAAPDFTRGSTLARFLAIATGASAVSATFAALILADPSVWRIWFLADTLGLLLLTPMLTLIVDRSGADAVANRWIEWVFLSVVGVAVTAIAFSQHQTPLLFLIFPPLIAASFRLGMRGAAAVTFLALVVAFVFTISGAGPIAENMPDPSDRVLFLQFYAVVALLTALPIAAVLAERTRLIASLAASEQRFRTLAEAAPAGIFRSDRSGAVTYVNRAWSELTGLAPDAAKDSGWLKVLALGHRERAAEIWRSALGVGWDEAREIRYFRQPEGEERWAAVTVAAERDEAGIPLGQVGIVFDITARKQMERELIAARDQAQAATRAKASFLANMSHEIRTPLNGILGFAELLADSPIAPEQARFASFIRESGRELLRLLNDILDLSKIEADQLQIEQAPFSAADELRSCARLLDAAIRAKGLAFDLAIESAVETPMLGDSLRFRQIALNLLSNAAKFTETGSISVTAKVRRKSLVVEFTDTGIGIETEVRKHIFDPFTQADASSTRKYGGTGLGLGISRQLSELMGGDILLVSRKGVGTTVTLRLPFNPANQIAESALAGGVTGKSRADTRERHILVVEDIEINRELVCAILNSAHYRISTADNGRQALALVSEQAAANKLYDLILMDVQMPVMDGLAATRAIRALKGPASKTPILALTAHAYAAEVQACVDAGMNGHLAKPVSAPVLLDRIAECLEEGGERRKAAVLDATVEALRPMFEDQKREAHARLVDIQSKLPDAADRGALYLEAASLAHKVAGFAGTFGEEGLTLVARQKERILAQVDASEGERDAALNEIVQALHPTPTPRSSAAAAA